VRDRDECLGVRFAPSPRRVGLFEFSPVGMGRRMASSGTGPGSGSGLARDRGRVRVGEVEGRLPAAGPGSADRTELRAGACFLRQVEVV